MKCVLGNSNIVENVIIADDDFIESIRPQYDLVDKVNDDCYVGPGFGYKIEDNGDRTYIMPQLGPQEDQ